MRNFEDVRFGEYLIRTWYYSPYPMALEGDPLDKRGRKRKDAPEEPKSRVSGRNASDVLQAGVGKDGEGAMGRLWVCDVSRAMVEVH